MGPLSKILTLTGRYAFFVFVAASIVLFAPDEAASRTGLYGFRYAYGSALWAVFALSGAATLGMLLHYLSRKALAPVLATRRDRKMREALKKETLGALALKLEGLGADEKMWIKYCLFHNTPLLSAQGGNRTADALNAKGLVEEGTGHFLDLPFVIPDEIWRYLVEHKDEFLDENELNDIRFIGTLENFRKSLGPGNAARGRA